MHCASCVSLIQNKVSKISGVEKATVGLATEKATVSFTGKAVPLSELNASIEPFGYTLEEIPTQVASHHHTASVSDQERENKNGDHMNHDHGDEPDWYSTTCDT